VRLAIAVVPVAAEAIAKALPRAPAVRIDPQLAPDAAERDGDIIWVGARLGERVARMSKRERRQWAKMIG
jgi:hypothetical protein